MPLDFDSALTIAVCAFCAFMAFLTAEDTIKDYDDAE